MSKESQEHHFARWLLEHGFREGRAGDTFIYTPTTHDGMEVVVYVKHGSFKESGARIWITRGGSSWPTRTEFSLPAAKEAVEAAVVEVDQLYDYGFSGFGAARQRSSTAIPRVRFAHWIESEEAGIVGNVLASGDEAADREAEQWVRDELRAGNQAAWAFACVTAKLDIRSEDPDRYDYELEGRAGLGACSYRSERELWADLLEPMKAEAVGDLVEQLRKLSSGPRDEYGVPMKDRALMQVVLDELLETYS